MASKFGGTPVDEPKKPQSKFGGTPVDESKSTDTKGDPYAGLQNATGFQAVGSVLDPLYRLMSGAATAVPFAAGRLGETAKQIKAKYFSGDIGSDEYKQAMQDLENYRKARLATESDLTYVPRSISGRDPTNIGNAVPAAIGELLGHAVPNEIQDPQTAMDYAKNVGHEVLPLAYGYGLGMTVPPLARGIKNVTKSGAQSLMRNVLNATPTDYLKNVPDRVARYLLENNLGLTKSSIENMQKRIGLLGEQTDQLIQPSSAVVSLEDMLQPVGESTKNFRTTQATKNQNAINSVIDQFKEHPDLTFNYATGQQGMPLRAVQALKKAEYAQLGNHYDPDYMALLPEEELAAIAARQGIARGAKNAVARHVPATIPLNAEMETLYNAIRMAQRRSAQSSASPTVPLAFILAHEPTSAIVSAIGRIPQVQAATANLINRSAGPMSKIIGGTYSTGPLSILSDASKGLIKNTEDQPQP